MTTEHLKYLLIIVFTWIFSMVLVKLFSTNIYSSMVGAGIIGYGIPRSYIKYKMEKK